MLYLALIPGNYVGWGVCSRYLIKELGNITKVEVLDQNNCPNHIDGEIFHTIGDHNLTRAMNITGEVNYGYTFFESILPENALENAEQFDLVFAGSTWCKDKLLEKGITWSEVLIQGIDRELFYPSPEGKTGAADYFVIYSGGKFELRKGQDIIIRAVKVLQDRHKDILFVNCWHNSWAFSMNTMSASPYINYRPNTKCSTIFINQILVENGIDISRVESLPLISQDQLRMVYQNTDIGIFPNRCEGGTNLVLMEYMACGKPVIASYTSGHRDIINENNSILLKKLKPFDLTNQSQERIAEWEDPDLEETIEAMEFCYQNRDSIKNLGDQAGKDMINFTWHHTAQDLFNKINVFRENSNPEP